MTREALPARASEVLGFWFGERPAATVAELEAKLGRWFGDPQLKRDVQARFADLVEEGAAGGLREWERSPLGTLALLVVLDQLMRTFYGMEDARAYAAGDRAADLAARLFEGGLPDEWTAEHHFFALVPLGHSERLEMHRRALPEALRLVERAPLHLRPIFETVTAQLIRFTSVIERFGRFPHRNAALGRESTDEEIELLRTWEIRHPARGYRDQIAAAQRIEDRLRGGRDE